MKKILLKLTCLSILLILGISCSKDDVITNPIVPETVVVPTTFTILPDPNITLNNLQVGNKIEYNVKIQNFDTNPDVLYVLKPVSGNAVKHQLRGTDYHLQSLEANDAYVNRDSIVIKNTNSKVYIQILKPGSFQHEYTLQKMILNKKINPEAKQPVLFNAVKITAWTPESWQQPDNWFRLYIFQINDGDQAFDNYLTNSATKSHTYSSLCFGGTLSGEFTAHNQYYFKVADGNNNYFPPPATNLIDLLTITQNVSGGNVNIINYSNIYF